MKLKVFIAALSIVFVLILVFFVFKKDNKKAVNVLGTETAYAGSTSYKPSPTEFAIPTPSKPKTLLIPKLSVKATVEEVGADKEGKMDVPGSDLNAGWWKYGVIPGQMGNAVLAGHYDRKDGGPAIFYALNTLSPGDELIVIDEKGAEKKFAVENVASYKIENFPLEAIFGSTNERNLNLITCSGTWDTLNKNYSDRLVVTSKLVGE